MLGCYVSTTFICVNGGHHQSYNENYCCLGIEDKRLLCCTCRLATLLHLAHEVCSSK